MTSDPKLIAIGLLALTAAWLLTVSVHRWQIKRNRRDLSAAMNDLTDIFTELADLRISLIDHLSSPQKPLRTGPVTMPVVVAAPTTDELTAWADELMGQQEPPDPEPHTVMIPRVPATRHNPSEPKTTTISVAEIAARLKAERSKEAAE